MKLSNALVTLAAWVSLLMLPGIAGAQGETGTIAGEVKDGTGLFRGKIVDVGKETLMVELSGTEEKLEACLELLKPYGIEELARTGVICGRAGIRSRSCSPDSARWNVRGSS